MRSNPVLGGASRIDFVAEQGQFSTARVCEMAFTNLVRPDKFVVLALFIPIYMLDKTVYIYIILYYRFYAH